MERSMDLFSDCRLLLTFSGGRLNVIHTSYKMLIVEVLFRWNYYVYEVPLSEL